MIPNVGKLLYFCSVYLNKDMLPEPSGETGRKECTSPVEFAELGKGGGDGNFAKGEKACSVMLGEEPTLVKLLFFADTVLNFFTCALHLLLKLNTKE